MMRTWAPLVLTLLAGGLLHSSAAEPETVYQWRIFPLPAVSRVLLKLTEQKGSSTIGHSEDVDFSELRGLDRSQTFGAKVVFQIHRDAGTLYCKGGFALGFGEGSVAFVPDPRFVSALREMGFAQPDRDRLFDLAVANTHLSYIREIHDACNCARSLDDVVDFANHGVDGEYLRDLRRNGGSDLRPTEVIELKDHGVPASLLLEARDAGLAVRPGDLVNLHDHGISPRFVRQVREAGLRASPDELIALHDHGVESSLIRAARESGLKASVDSLVSLHDHGVSAQFVTDMVPCFHPPVDAAGLIELRDHGVSPVFARRLADSGFAGAKPDEMIRLMEHGVSADLIAQAHASHRGPLSVDDVIQLQENGVSAGFLRAFDDAGYAALSARELVELQNNGVTADYARRLQREGYGNLSVAQLIKFKQHGME